LAGPINLLYSCSSPEYEFSATPKIMDAPLDSLPQSTALTNHPIVQEAQEARQRAGVGLCLSGGGFRAALFHLGSMRRLHELGILQQLRTLSAVSGGSIIAGHLATRMVELGLQSLSFKDWQSDVAIPFRRFAQRDLRTLPVILHILWNPFYPHARSAHMERRYRRRLTSKKLSDLPDTPEFILCATDLLFGVNWEFSRKRTGDYRAGYLKNTAEIPLAHAIAASASFPPLFGPMRVKATADDYSQGGLFRKQLIPLLGKVQLTDGGVYDNMGLEPVWKDHASVLVSDCGAPFDFRIGTSPLRRILRYTSVIMNQARALRLRSFFDEINNRTYEGCYWSLATGFGPKHRPAPGYSQELVDSVLSNIRTDLDNFSEAEMNILENHGYCVTDRKILKYVPQLIRRNAPVQPPYPEWLDETAARKALRNSGRRVLPSRFIAALKINVVRAIGRGHTQ
jgi:NTE family protein